MKESRKIQVLQKMVDRLQLNNQELKNENNQLREQLEAERDRCIEKEKQLDTCIVEYKKLIQENKKIKNGNLRELSNLRQLKEKYNKKMNKIIRKTKRSI